MFPQRPIAISWSACAALLMLLSASGCAQPARAQPIVDPHEFGAAGDCAQDDTAAYRAAIAAARNKKMAVGGAGCFKITGALDIAGVTIRAPYTSFTRSTPSPKEWGHTLAHAGSDPLFRPAKGGWALEGVTLYDPAQDGKETMPVTRPPMILLENENTDWTIRGTVVVNAYDFLRTSAASIVGDARLVDNRIYAVHTVYDLRGQVPETVYERGNTYTPGVFQSQAVFGNNGNLARWTAANGTVRRIDVGGASVDGWSASFDLQYGYARAVDVVSGLLNLAVFTGERFDQVQQILRISGSGAADMQFTGGYGYLTRAGDPRPPAAAFDLRGNGTQSVQITGFRGAFTGGNWCNVDTSAPVLLTVRGGTFENHGEAQGSSEVAACRINASQAVVTFRPDNVRGSHGGTVGVEVANASRVEIETSFDQLWLPVEVKSSVASAARVVDRSTTSRTTGPASIVSKADPRVLAAAGTYDKLKRIVCTSVLASDWRSGSSRC